MKKVLLTFGLLAFIAGGVAAQSTTSPAAPVKVVNPNAPTMTFETDVIDYGTIEQGADGVREFKFTNTGKEPLIISNARGSCGCTVPTWPKEPIKPGESSVIKVKYDTKRLGAINKSVTITSNAATPTKVIRIKGKIIAPQTSPVKENAGAPTEK
ncbi:MAG: hypothetical protein COA97_10745 [Flavobacteriales bacterium]|nr:MAG: hypothetical protein COA97_10745 [Flavobacteriales bacterium]